MDYLNPVSIAQMANVPKNTSLPGSGYGLARGYLEGQAMNQAKDFLQMSKAGAAQEFVKKQFDSQTAWTDRPLNLQIKREELAKSQADRQYTEAQTKQLNEIVEDLKRKGKFESTATFGQASDFLENAAKQGPMQFKMAWEDLIKRMQFEGHPLDESLSWDGTPQGAQRIIELAKFGKAVTSMRNSNVATMRNVDAKEGGDNFRQSRQIASNEKIASEGNATALAIAQLKAAHESGKLTTPEYLKTLDEAIRPILAKEEAGQPLTADERSVKRIWEASRPQLPGTMVRTDPERKGAAAGAQTRETFEALREEGGLAPKKPKPSNKPLPESEREVQERLKRYED